MQPLELPLAAFLSIELGIETLTFEPECLKKVHSLFLVYCATFGGLHQEEGELPPRGPPEQPLPALCFQQTLQELH